MSELLGTPEIIRLKEAFLEDLAEVGFISRAAPSAQRTERQVRRWIKADVEFSERVDEAREAYWAGVREAGLARAVDGVAYVKYSETGQVVARSTKYSDNLMKFFLERYDPAICDKPERVSHEHTTTSELDKIDLSHFKTDADLEEFIRLHSIATGKKPEPDEDAEEESENESGGQ